MKLERINIKEKSDVDVGEVLANDDIIQLAIGFMRWAGEFLTTPPLSLWRYNFISPFTAEWSVNKHPTIGRGVSRIMDLADTI